MNPSRGERIPVGVLAATGAVGQRFVQLLADHPWFELREVSGSERGAGRLYGEVAAWRLPGGPPEGARDLIVRGPDEELTSPILFSALPAESAGAIEARFAAAGKVVFSNARNHRMEPDVPLIVPEVNADHAAALAGQRTARGWSGAIITNPNCSTIHLVLALKPLQDAFGLDAVLVTTLQATSGAGYPGVPSLDLIDNIVPYIGGEEEKMAIETRKILGDFDPMGGFSDAPAVVSATCTRVRCGTATPRRSPSASGARRPWTRSPPPCATSAARPRRSVCRAPRYTRSSSSTRTIARSPPSTATLSGGWRPSSVVFALARSSGRSSSCSATTPSAARPEPRSSTPRCCWRKGISPASASAVCCLAARGNESVVGSP
jgi:aspartate-semialdehyde dehydrogenase